MQRCRSLPVNVENGARRPKKTAVPAPPDGSSAQRWESPTKQWLEVVGARHNNLRDVGRDSVGNAHGGQRTGGAARLTPGRRALPGAPLSAPGQRDTRAHDEVRGVEFINKVIRVDHRR